MARKQVERGISYDEERGCYYVYMDRGRDEYGRRRRGYQTAPTLRQARQLQRAFHACPESFPLLAKDLTVREWMEYWIDGVVRPSRAPTTVYSYRKMMVNHLLPVLGNLPLNQLTTRRIQQYYSMLMDEKGLSANTVHRHHAMLSSALHCAVRQEVLHRCPTELAELPKVPHKEIHFYNGKQLRALLSAAEGTILYFPIRITASLGLRREELCGLRWSNIDFEQHRIHICTARTCAGGKVIEKDTKNRSSTRVLEPDDSLFALIESERQRQIRSGLYSPNGLILLDTTGEPWEPNRLSACMCSFVRARGLPPITLHGLRHTFATLACAQGVPLYDIGRALGHSTPATTGKIYTHLLDEGHSSTLATVARIME